MMNNWLENDIIISIADYLTLLNNLCLNETHFIYIYRGMEGWVVISVKQQHVQETCEWNTHIRTQIWVLGTKVRW